MTYRTDLFAYTVQYDRSVAGYRVGPADQWSADNLLDSVRELCGQSFATRDDALLALGAYAGGRVRAVAARRAA